MNDIWLDLSKENPYSQFLMTVMGGVNQLERNPIRMRQREEKMTVKQICEITNISRSALYRRLSEEDNH